MHGLQNPIVTSTTIITTTLLLSGNNAIASCCYPTHLFCKRQPLRDALDRPQALVNLGCRDVERGHQPHHLTNDRRNERYVI